MGKSLFITLALAAGLAGAAAAQTEPFADVDNDGLFGPGDVKIGALVNNDGQFSTAVAEGAWVPRDGKVGIVVPGRFIGKKKAVVLKASGDITVHGTISVAGIGGVVVLLSTDGSVHVDPRVRIQTDTIVQLIAMHDVTVGDGVMLSGRSNDFSMVSVASQAGDVTVGNGVSLGADGLVEIATNQASGGCIEVGTGARLTSGKGAVRVTAGDHVAVGGARVSARDILVGSNASTTLGRAGRGPGYVSLGDSLVRSRNGRVHVYANGNGGTIDASDASLQAATRADVILDADVVVR